MAFVLFFLMILITMLKFVTRHSSLVICSGNKMCFCALRTKYFLIQSITLKLRNEEKEVPANVLLRLKTWERWEWLTPYETRNPKPRNNFLSHQMLGLFCSTLQDVTCSGSAGCSISSIFPVSRQSRQQAASSSDLGRRGLILNGLLCSDSSATEPNRKRLTGALCS